MTLSEARKNIGARVWYCPHGRNVQLGIIKRVNERYVFVHYDNDNQAKATRSEDLVFFVVSE